MKDYKKNIIRFIYITILIIVFILIFYFSGQNGEKSSSLSEGFLDNILKVFNISPESRIQIINNFNFFIRKVAHFSIYCVVGIDSMLLLNTYDIKKSKRIAIAISIGVIYSIFDEIHQTFINGRSGSFTDVLLDSSGVITGALIVIALTKIYYNIKRSKNI